MSTKPLVEILYCHECGYLPDAVTMADKLLREFNTRLDGIKVVSGDNGSFEVSIDDRLVFSKLNEGRFPALKEIRDAIWATLDTGKAAQE